MSTRWYPIYQKGNPQLRIFLPNFWMKLVAPDTRQPECVVQFHCSMEMTKADIKNYLTKIYNIDVVTVRTRIALGRFIREPQKKYIMKLDDVKVAYVTLPKDQQFTFPDLFPKEKKDATKTDADKALEDMKNSFKNYLEKNKERPGIPSWYTI
ncbi:probable 39S ribosomal protein L23, mitochondrial [Diprion similis]|uniref:probable 39S ribosomal protein L23, mitochondrial n=1 Tax=Diprion similis TaxID=362088 RepID=UPI001EF89FB1|nr:probable 39S ribosomal protein L23, mitochondrial [Diprion similis]